MKTQTTQFHGSDLETIQQLYGIQKEEIVSFSANVNPLGLSRACKEALARQLDVISAYPDREYRQLKQCISAYCGGACEHIITGNGSTELISLFIQLLAPKKALILAPTYSEYEREVRLTGGDCSYFQLSEDTDFQLETEALCHCLTTEFDLLVICNPNNPTSSVVTTKQMEQIVRHCQSLGIFVLVDETYAEFVSELSDISSISLTDTYDNLAVLRGVSKFFAAPGLRLGYSVTKSPILLTGAAAKQNPWTVSSIADAAGQLLFADLNYQQTVRALISKERRRVLEKLRQLPALKAYPAYANFVLVRFLNQGLTSDKLFDRAIRQGMMIRSCSSFPFLDQHYFRFCFMLPADNDRLLHCICDYVSSAT